VQPPAWHAAVHRSHCCAPSGRRTSTPERNRNGAP
jgi:hypothetical protein